MTLRLTPDRRWPFIVYEGTGDSLPPSTIALLLVAGFSSITVLFTPPGLVGLVLGIAATVSWRRSKRARCRRLTRAGWISYVAVILLQVVITLADAGTP